MASVPMAFDTMISAQARQVDAADAPSLEHVAATVRRVTGFTQIGRAASGHVVAVDEPTAFGGGGSAADPAELFLVAIGASLSVTLTVHASLSGVPLDTVEVELSGKLDAARFFRPSAANGGGFFDLEIAVAVTSAATPAAVRAIVDTALLASPVLRSIAAAPTVMLTVSGVPA